MTAQILDGQKLSGELKQQFQERIKYLDHPIGLGTLLVGDDPASQRYVAMKHKDCEEVGIRSIPVQLNQNASQYEILEAVDRLNADPNCTGFIVQLPLPPEIDETVVLERIAPSKDADGLHPVNLGKLVLKVKEQIYSPLPCTPLGIVELLKYYHLDISGKSAVILGRGPTAGRPLSLLFSRNDINATVTVAHTGTADLPDLIGQAEVLVSAIGRPHFITADLVKPGAIVFDVGVSRVTNADGSSQIVGDVDPEVAEVASWLTPNPGGVGPMTRAMLLKNVLDLGSY
jgi:methylenetetrahydrofolate dehydrogenase (NADP+)/methenyltetrahydrofolate cyclohydrolase